MTLYIYIYIFPFKCKKEMYHNRDAILQAALEALKKRYRVGKCHSVTLCKTIKWCILCVKCVLKVCAVYC